jgi:tetratricopeptide (TPR) repeat protein
VTAKRTWANKIVEARESNFIGRTDEQRYFTDNFVGDEPRYLLYSVTGEGGVGKSTLLLQYERLARSPSINAIIIRCDDRHLSPASAMAFIAERLKVEGFSNKDFDDRLKAHRAAREEIENDPKAPRGALDMVVRGATDFTVKAARKAPGVGVFAEYVDEKAVGEALSQGINYVIDKWGNKDEVRLVREPEAILTPLLVKLIAQACAKRKLILMFDVFERTSDALEPWLFALLNNEYGDLDMGTTFVIAGRDSLDQRWTALAGVVCYVTLEPFSEDETRDYLSRQDITNLELVKQIHSDTGGLPVLVELLASRKPQQGQPLPDISGDAVARFLSWIPDEAQRHAVLLAAVPRQFNQDVLSAAWGSDASSQFAWLTSQSFIRTSAVSGAFFHEKVRELMLRHVRQTTPDDLSNIHERLANYFVLQQAKLELTDGATYTNQSWRRFEQERVYHTLSQRPGSQLKIAINAFALAFSGHRQFSKRIVEVIAQASRECYASAMRQMGDTLHQLYVARDKLDHERFIGLATVLLNREDLVELARAGLYTNRGFSYHETNKFDEALKDFTCAIELNEKYAWAFARRGVTYRSMGKFDEALKDFTCAIELNDKYAWAIVQRGITYDRIGKFDKALQDFTRAIELDDKYAWAFARRGVTYRSMDKFDEALQDFTRAIELDDKYAWAFARRGITYYAMGKFEDALVDLTRAIELNGKDANVFSYRGEMHRLAHNYQSALSDFDQALMLNNTDGGAFARRGDTCRALGRYYDAIQDLSAAIELDPKMTDYPRSRRAAVYLKIGQLEKAQEDIRIVKDTDTANPYQPYNIAIVCVLNDQVEEAIAILSQLIEKDSLARIYAQHDDLFDPIRHIPEFQALVAPAT